MLYKDYLEHRRPYQIDGHLFLLQRKHCCLYFKPGKGKTFPCIDAIRDINESKNGNAKVLILSTADAIREMWTSEILPQKILPENTVLCSFSSAIVEARKKQLLKVKWDIIVVDECHKVKAHNTKTSRLVFMLSRNAEYVFGLSGTPRANSDVDLFCQFHNMRIGEWGDISYTQFVDYCCDIDKKYFGGQMIKVPIGVTEKYKAGWERNIAMYTMRADYTDEDDMPPLNTNVIEFPFKRSKEYEDAEQGLLRINDYETTMTKLAATNKLHQAANGYLYVPLQDGIKIYNFQYNIKLDWLKEHIANEPTTVVYRFKADFNAITDMLNSNAITWTENVNDFQKGKARVLILQCSRCESFNLQMCKHLIFYTIDYSFIKFDQMLHRVWRMGQKQEVNIDILIFKHSIESKIWKIVNNKQTFSDLFYAIKAE